MAGSKVKMWKQDPSVPHVGIRAVFLPSTIEDGLRDDMIEVELEGLEVNATCGRDFLFDPNENPAAFDAVHTFSVVRQVVTMYQRALRRIASDIPIRWQWNTGRLKVYPLAGMDRAAFYSREEGCLKFFFFFHEPTRQVIYTCQSFDLVAHETGHAILDGLKPGFHRRQSGSSETSALRESFADLTAIFTMIAQLDICEAVIAESGCDLHNKTFFPVIGEQYSRALNRRRSIGLRTAANNLKADMIFDNSHSLSQVLTGAVYDIIADIFEDQIQVELYDPADTLRRVGQHVTGLVVGSFIAAPDKDATLSDIANGMLRLEKDALWKRFMWAEFRKRRVEVVDIKDF